MVRRPVDQNLYGTLYGSVSTVLCSVDLAQHGKVYGAGGEILLGRRTSKRGCRTLLSGAALSVGLLSAVAVVAPQPAHATCTTPTTGSGTCAASDGIAITATGNLTITITGDITPYGAYIDATGGAYNVRLRESYSTSPTHDITNAFTGGAYHNGAGVEIKSGGGNVIFSNIGYGDGAGDVYGNVDGLRLTTSGTGKVIVYGSGTITGDDGIYAYTEKGAIDIYTAAPYPYYWPSATVFASGDGIHAESGAGPLKGGPITIVSGNVFADGTGIYARTGDSSKISITAYGEIEGDYFFRAGNGIVTDAQNGATTIKTYGNIFSYGDAIVASSADGAIHIYAHEALDSSGGNGVGVTTANGAVVVHTEDVFAYDDGVHVVSTGGGGSVTIRTYGDVYGDPGIYASVKGATPIDIATYGFTSGFYGIETDAVDGATTINTHGDVYGSYIGIRSHASGDGDISIGVYGYHTVYGGSHGIFADAYNGNVSVTTGGNTTVYGFSYDGIHAYSRNGDVSVVANGNVIGKYGNGIYGIALYSTNSVNIKSYGFVEGGDADIRAYTLYGNIYVRADGYLSGNADFGVYANVAGNASGGGITIKGSADIGSFFNPVSYDGIYARIGDTFATGNITIAWDGAIYADDGVRVIQNGFGKVDVTTGYIYTSGGDGIHILSDGGNVTVHADGNVNADDTGIWVKNTYTGGVNITAGNVTGRYGDGIYAYANVGSVTVHATGFVSGNDGDGIHAISDGSAHVYADAGAYGFVDGIHTYSSFGDTKITFGGNVTGAFGDGIHAYAYDGNIDIEGSGGATVSGYNDGIFARSAGGNYAVTVHTDGLVTGYYGDGIYAYSESGPVTVHAEGFVRGFGGDGIHAISDGSAHVYADAGAYGFVDGIHTYSSFGDTKITFGGNVTGAFGDGIHAYAYDGNIDIEGSGGATVSGYANGVFALASGKAGYGLNVTVHTSGLAYGYELDGIYARSKGADGFVHVYADGGATGAEYGIYARTSGAGDVVITFGGDVTGYNEDGIRARTEAGNISITDVAAPDVYGYHNGIHAYSSSGGNILVDVAGNVTGNLNDGVYANTEGGSGAVSVHVGGDVSGGDFGVFARTFSGNIGVTLDGDVFAGNDDGVNTHTTFGDTTIDVGGNIYAGRDGVHATSFDGNIGIKTHGFISAGNIGVYAYSRYGAIDVINYGDIDPVIGIDAIDVFNDISVKSYGGIYSYHQGILTSNVFGDTYIYANDINASSSSKGSYDAIHATSYSGGITVREQGNIWGGYADRGIYAESTFGGIDVINYGDIDPVIGIEAHDVFGGISVKSYGDITADHQGILTSNVFGYTYISSAGNIDASTASKGTYDAIHATSYSGGIGINVKGNIVGGYADRGIYAASTFGGISIKSYGTIDPVIGIEAHDFAAPIAVYNFGSITSGHEGILTTNVFGYTYIYSADIDASNASFGSYNAIDATSYYGGVGVHTGAGSLIAGNVDDGIHVRVTGSTYNGIFVDADGDIGTPFNTVNGDGIDVAMTSGGSTGSIFVYGSGNIYAYGDGIRARTEGYGDIRIGSFLDPFSGNIHGYGSGAHGIYAAINQSFSTAYIDIYTSGNVSGNSDGIYARNSGYGSIFVHTAGNVSSKYGDGILAFNDNSGSFGDVVVKADPATIFAFGDGIHATTAGFGTVAVFSDDAITGPGGYAGGDGIYARILNGSSFSGVYVYGAGDPSPGAIHSYGDGVYVRNAGYGSLTVGNRYGIYGAFGSDIHSYGTSGQHGIDARITNYFGGSIHIDATGDIVSDGDAVYARNDGIFGSTYVRTGGDITSYSGDGIHAFNTAFFNGFFGGGSVTVVADYNNIYAANNGITATTAGFGSVHVFSDDGVSGPGGGGKYANGFGIYAGIYNGSSSAGVYVYGAGSGDHGTIHSYKDGVHVFNDGYGSLTVGSIYNNFVADVHSYGDGNHAIYARQTHYFGFGHIEIFATGNLESDGDTVYARNDGYYWTYVRTGGNVTSHSGDGIHAFNTKPGSFGFVTVIADTNTIYAAGDGIHATTWGSGGVYVVEDDNITGPGGRAGGYGVFARHYNYFTYGNVTVYGAGGTIDSYADGVNALSYGHGDVSVGTSFSHFADDINASGYSANGIDAFVNHYFGASGDVQVWSDGNIHASQQGILAHSNSEFGDVYVYAKGNITSDYNDGIEAFIGHYYDSYGSVAVHFESGTIYAPKGNGIYAHTNNYGAVTVVSNGDIGSPGNHVGYNGIEARINHYFNFSNVRVYGSGDIYSYDDGIFVRTVGFGDLIVGDRYGYGAFSGDIHSYGKSGQHGVDALIYSFSGGDIHIDVTGNVSSDGDAIYARNNGFGNVYARTGGNITSYSGDGIHAFIENSKSYGSVFVLTDPAIIYAPFGDGINATTIGFGDVTVVNGDQIGGKGGGGYVGLHGIYAGSFSSSPLNEGNVTVYSGPYNIYADGGAGIEAFTFGRGNVSVGKSFDHVTSGIWAPFGFGIQAFIDDSKSTGYVQVWTDGDIYSYGDGIRAYTNGRGDVTVYQGAPSTIHAYGFGADGIDAFITGGKTGTVRVYSYGTITSDHADGIRAYGNTDDSVIVHQGATGAITANVDGIRATSNHPLGDGSVRVYVGGNIHAGGDGVYAETNQNGDVGVIAYYGSYIFAYGDGIEARANGGTAIDNSNTTVINDGVIFAFGDGIYAYSDSGFVHVTTGAFSSTAGYFGDGIHAFAPDGEVTVTTGFDSFVEGGGGDGIFAYSKYGTRVTTGSYSTVEGFLGDGIYAYSKYGNTKVTTGFDSFVLGYFDGIHAVSDGDVTVKTGAFSTIVAGGDGIYALAVFGNALVSTGFDSAIYAGLDGIDAVAIFGDTTVNLGSYTHIESGADGVYAYALYGDVSVSGGSGLYIHSYFGDGIHAYAYGDGYSARVHLGDYDTIVAYNYGIFAHANIGPAEIVTGHDTVVVAGNIGILAIGDAAATVTVGASSFVYGGNVGIAAIATFADSNVTVGNDSTVIGGNVAGIAAIAYIGNASTHLGNYEFVYGGEVGIADVAIGGDATVTGGDFVTAIGGDYAGVIALASGGDASVALGTYANVIGGAVGILATGIGGDASVSLGRDSFVYGGDTGIEALALGGDATVTLGRDTTVIADSPYGTGILADAFGGDATVSAGNGFTAVSLGDGVVAEAIFGDATITMGNDAFIYAGNGDGIHAYAFGGGYTAYVHLGNGGNIIAGNGDGIYARANIGPARVVTGTGTSIYAGDVGIFAEGDAPATVIVGAYSLIVTGGDSIDAFATFGDSTVVLGSSSTLVSFGGWGIDALAFGGNADVNGGSSEFIDVDGIGVRAYAVGGDASVTFGSDLTILAGGYGIYAGTLFGSASVSVGSSAYIHSFYGTGIDADGYFGDATVTLGKSSTIIADYEGIKAIAAGGDASVFAGDSLTVISGYDGIYAEAFYGNTTVHLGSSTYIHAVFGDGVFARAIFGNVSVSGGNNNTIVAFYDGVHAHAIYGDTSVTFGNNLDIVAGGSGIDASTYHGDVTVTAGNNAYIHSFFGYAGIRAYAYDGTVDVTLGNNGNIIAGSYYYGDGIYARGNDGEVNVTTGTGTSIFASGVGIFAEGDAPATVVVGAGSLIVAGGDDIDAFATFGDATVSVGSGSELVSFGGTGIDAFAFVGNASVTLGHSDAIFAYDDGIYAKAIDGNATVTAGTSTYIAAGGDGIHTFAEFGNASVSLGSGSTIHANADGIYAHTFVGSASVTGGNGEFITAGGEGVDVHTYDGDASVAFGENLVILSLGDGIYAKTSGYFGGDTSVHLGDNAFIYSFYGDGIHAYAYDGNVGVTLGTGGNIIAAGYGIYARGNVGAATVHTGTGTHISSGDVGIFADGDGPATVVVGAYSLIVSGGDSIDAFASFGDATVSLGKSSTLVSFYGDGINSDAFIGDSSVTLGDSDHIYAFGGYASGDGVRSVAIVGDASVSGGRNEFIEAAGYGVLAYAFDGDASVTFGNNLVVVSGSDAIYDGAIYGDATVTVGNDAFVYSYSGDGIHAYSYGGGYTAYVHLGNSGTVIAGNGDGIYARANIGAARVVTGTGTVIFAGGDGIFAEGDGPATVVVGAGSLIVAGGDAIDAFATFGDATVSLGSSSTLVSFGGNGIYSDAFIGSSSVTLGDSDHIYAFGGDGVRSVALVGDASVSGGKNELIVAAAGDGVHDFAFGGDASVTFGKNLTILSLGDGIEADAIFGDATVTVGNNAYILSFYGDGIHAYSYGFGYTAYVHVGDSATVLAYGDGIYARGYVGSARVVTGTGTYISAGGRGIVADGDGSATVIVGKGSTILANGDDIFAFSLLGDATVDVGANSTLRSFFSHGIFSESVLGNNSVTLGTSDKIYAYSHGIYTVSILGNTDVHTGKSAFIRSYYGDGIRTVSILGDTAVTLDNNNLVIAYDDAIHDLSVLGDIAVTTGDSTVLLANYGDGIYSEAILGDITVTVGNSNTILAYDDGIEAVVFGSGDSTVDVGNNTLIHAYYGDGVHARGDGDATVHLGNDSLILAPYGDGIDAWAYGGGKATVTTGTDSGIFAKTFGIYAWSDGGPVSVTTGDGSITAGGSDGIRAYTYGSGHTDVTTNGVVVGTFDAGIYAVSGTGGLNVTANASVYSYFGNAIRTSTTGNATITIDNSSLALGYGKFGVAVIDMTTAATYTTTLNINSGSLVSSFDPVTISFGDLALKSTGANSHLVVNNGGTLYGRVDFSGMTGALSTSIINNTSFLSWHTTGTSNFTAGADTINNSGLIATNAGGVATTWNFDGGTDTINNLLSGRLVVGEPALAASTLTITGLEFFNNAGTIAFGSGNSGATSDGATDDRILSAGTVFTGSGNSLMLMDAFLSSLTQTSCVAFSGVADCMQVGSSFGNTRIRVTDTDGPWGAYNPTGILLVGDTSAQNNALFGTYTFSLDAYSSWYNPFLFGGVLDKPGFFFYDLLYNGAAATPGHYLVGLPKPAVFELPVLATAGQGIWYETAPWLSRQADLRDQAGDGGTGPGQVTPGVWMKAIGDWLTRDKSSTYTFLGKTYPIDTSYNQRIYGLVAGFDFGRGNIWAQGDTFLAGISLGYTESSLDFDALPGKGTYKGPLIGAYLTYLRNGLFVDVSAKANFLDLNFKTFLGPTLKISPNVTNVGGQVEAGKRYALGRGGLFIEPLVTADYVRTTTGSFTRFGTTVNFHDDTSARLGIGARTGITTMTGSEDMAMSVSLTGRIWDDFDGASHVDLASGGPVFTASDRFPGVFGEVGGNINLFDMDSNWSAFLNSALKFNGGFTSGNVVAGFRYHW